jgi:hypothetical protein
MFNLTSIFNLSILVDQKYIVTMKIIINDIKGKDFIIDEKDSLCKRFPGFLIINWISGLKKNFTKMNIPIKSLIAIRIGGEFVCSRNKDWWMILW